MTSAYLLALALVMPGDTAAQEAPATLMARAPSHGSQSIVALSLDDAVALARSRSYRLQRSLRSSESAELRQRAARAAAGPRIDSSLNLSQGGRGYEIETQFYRSRFDPYADFQGSVSVYGSLPIDISGVYRRQIAQANISADAAELEFEQGLLDVTFDAQSAYFALLRAQEAVRAEETIVTRLTALIEQARSAQPSIVPFLDIELANARQTLDAVESAAEVSHDALVQQLRLPSGTSLTLVSPVPSVPEEASTGDLISVALANRPEVKQLRLRKQQAQLSRVQIDDQRRPSLSLNGFANYGTNREHPFADHRSNSGSAAVFLNLNVPLGYYDGGLIAGSRRQADIQLEQIDSDVEEQRDRLTLEIRQGLSNVQRARQRLLTAPDVEAAQTLMRDSEQALLRAAPSDAPGLVAQASNVRNAWRQAHLSSVDARADYYLAHLRLQKVLGYQYELATGRTPRSE